MDFAALLRQDASLDVLARVLDSLSFDAARGQLGALTRDDQRRLFAFADPHISLSHFVADGVDPLAPVRHAGFNTLPLPTTHKRFAKVFARPQDGTPRLFGYNDAPSGKLIGPGYFVAVPTAGNPDWERRGAIVIDYFQVPDGPVPEGWPRVVPNSQGLQFFVYRRTRDFMRRVSERVSIGAAYRGEKALDHYFVLVRAD